MTSSICSIHWFSTLPNSPKPALFINKSICPNLSSICVPVLRTSSFFDISQVYATISAPLDSSTTCNVSFSSSNFDSERAISIIEPAPLFTKSRAACLPLPPFLTINLGYYYYKTYKSLFAKRYRQKRGQYTIHLFQTLVCSNNQTIHCLFEPIIKLISK